MAEDNGKVKQPENPEVYTIDRNGESLTFTEARTTKGNQPGKLTFNPDLSDIDRVFKWIGMDNLKGIVQSKFKQMIRNWADEATPELEDGSDGEFNPVKFKELAATFDSTGETLGDLVEERDELHQALLALDLDDAKNELEALKISRKLQQLTVAIGKKKRTRKPKTETAAAAVTA